MSDIQEIAQSIITDLMNDTPLSDILLKTKIYAFKRNDKQLQEWVESELNGYENNIPSYRLLNAGVKVNVHKGFQIINNFEFPIDLVEDIKIRKRLSRMPIFSSIYEIEEFSNLNKSSNITTEVPVTIWHNYMNHCIIGDIQRAYQYATLASLKKILMTVKALLIDYFMKIDNDDAFNFAQLMHKDEKDMIVDNRTIYTAAVINTGSGSIQTNNVSSVIGDGNTISITTKNELQQIIDEIEKKLQPSINDDCKELITDIKNEISLDSPNPTFLKRCLLALKSVAVDITTAVITDQVASLIGQALELL